MRQLLPTADDDVDAHAAYRADERPSHVDRPWVLLNMVTSLDGATAVGGRSRPLSSPADQAIFATLRTVADVVLVGAGTVRAEGYGPPKPTPERAAEGRPAAARLAVVSRRLELDPDMKIFAGDTPPIIITCATADPGRRTALEPVAELLVAGDDEVDLAAALARLHDDGAQVALCEGGPHLNAALLAAGLVDELCLMLSAQLAGGVSARAVAAAPEVGIEMRLARALEEDGDLYLRYVAT